MGHKLELMDGDGNWVEIGIVGEFSVELDKQEIPEQRKEKITTSISLVGNVHDVVVYGGARIGKSLARTLGLQPTKLRGDTWEVIAMDELAVAPARKTKGKGKRAHKAFARKLGGGW